MSIFASASSNLVGLNGSTPRHRCRTVVGHGRGRYNEHAIGLQRTIDSPRQRGSDWEQRAADAVIALRGPRRRCDSSDQTIDFCTQYVGGRRNDVVLTEPIPATMIVTTEWTRTMNDRSGTGAHGRCGSHHRGQCGIRLTHHVRPLLQTARRRADIVGN